MKLAGLFPGKNILCIAEIGINHNGDCDMAERMVRAAAQAGAHMVKFQTYVPELMYSPYTTSLLASGREGDADFSQIEFFRRFVLAKEDYVRLRDVARECGVEFFSSAFDEPSVDLLEEVGVRLYKIASSEVGNLRLLSRVARTAKPVIMSTGICTEDEIARALDLVRAEGCPDIALLHCVSNYPLDAAHANLRRISQLAERFGAPVGFSDHSSGTDLVGAAVALGARIFEKHFVHDPGYECPDRNVSVAPAEFAAMRQAADNALAALGDGRIAMGDSEKEVALSARRSLCAGRDIPAGKRLEAADVVPLRPGVGMPVHRCAGMLGRVSRRLIPKGHLIREEDFEEGICE
ncbi:MAG TPA: N-acetylneuraminate synthase family protein [Spirochaetota bacterium]|nr:N-acetylneuraminate synthase family protein [Spirochaetota bacterium]HNT10461.1 N-acetylneuraminate synthase family protein [Spirochaetota bacterium]